MSATAPSMTHLRRILVSGKVQGVFYRKHAQKAAAKLGITGWVRNLPDGRVEILAEGTRAQLDELERWCYEGSPRSRVSEVASLPVGADGDVGRDVSCKSRAESGDSSVLKRSSDGGIAPSRHFMDFKIAK
ncbi:unnamed protein product [Phytomonas sp. EM1]|nr:unnamed protein product [Phytomonas sp. EM1]|eukprot:CCW64337.1 unnamed protein product [Phytomonas sp. isolate EM1]